MLFLLTAANAPGWGADAQVDARKLRELHQKVREGQSLTPEEKAYYDQGKAQRMKIGQSRRSGSASATEAEAKPPPTLMPLSDMSTTDSYKGEDGGLYGAGRNTPPEDHLQAALKLAATIQPLDEEGNPSPQGKVVLLTHGMSNTTNEAERFIEVVKPESRKNPALLLIDGAQGGIDSRKWVNDTHTRRGTSPWQTLMQRIQKAGATPQQVQVVWMKHAVARPAQAGEFPKHATQLKDDTAVILQRLKQHLPNLKLAYISSRSYGGYARTDLNPEPFAYESAFAVRWLIQDQINGAEQLSHTTGRVPLLLWGPYLWADGEKGRKAGDLMFQREDFRDDGTHPSDTGRQKIAEQLLKFFSSDPTSTSWFLKP